MSYNKINNRPAEYASKSNHIHLIKDDEIQRFLNQHEVPKNSDGIELIDKYLVDIDFDIPNSIEFIVAVDGGNTSVPIKTKFPSSMLTFFQFGANLLNIKDLNSIQEQPFISPESISKLKELQRIKLALPTKNIGLVDNMGNISTLLFSIRKAIYDFFKKSGYLESLQWFLFEEYKTIRKESKNLASHPLNSSIKDTQFIYNQLTSHFIQPHPNGDLFLTDIFRLHEIIDEEFGAGGIISYLQNIIEHFIIIHTIKGLYQTKKNSLYNVLFIKDGPLGFFGQTANLHDPMRELVNHMQNELNLFLIGIEKSGPFVEHALEIKDKLPNGKAYLLSNEHIYKYIKPGNASNLEPYGKTSYYSSKVIFKSRDERVYVVTIPTPSSNIVLDPKKEDFKNLDVILSHIENLKTDLYDNSLLPIALVNKLVSLSDHPSSFLLEKFAKINIK